MSFIPLKACKIFFKKSANESTIFHNHKFFSKSKKNTINNEIKINKINIVDLKLTIIKKNNIYKITTSVIIN